ncbi:SWIRM domain protein Fun19, putative [Talaromyces stipitatus ATCC 10500]|uniref:SWIRM domain protein Fun19, putative n=1 Tax=Talaromyces stipitatus (strain ATCC 10500 / CBS 375.48 / QM 6759 / NRRL 1006) TaxID=441959 RepID=B8MIK5_TALSN|nr:SWIRM domain protein Fun19, putative [Talaromyces stipitatus ATCC 10500]EED15097.1 SWIRM domain protein Fun19, putative [Talaromyces stipitatus ATCC 10500]
MTTLPPLHNQHYKDSFGMNRLPSVSSLMSPPEPKPFDSFNSGYPSLTMSSENVVKLPPISDDRKRSRSDIDLPSPPVTPYAGNKKRRSSAEQLEAEIGGNNNRDPVLFPRNEPASDVHSDEPLFGPVLASAAEALIDQHMNSHMERFHNKVNKPTRDEYMLALSCVPIVSTQYNRNPIAWAREERETLERQMAMMDRVEYRPSNLKRLAPAPSKKTTSNSQPRPTKVSRPRRTPKSTPQQRVLDTFDIEYSPSTKPLRTIGTNRDDTDYNSLKDYSPPLETLGGNTKGLKADWKGQMLDLSNDPDRSLLDPAEISLAATLRLSCATYLCSKRRIFEARVKALSIGKEFRKTDAQQACKIDVNKASKLWTAYDRVGWFKPEHFIKFLKA